MRALGVLLALLGGGATTWLVAASFTARRPHDLALALAAPLALTVAILGLVLAFVPGFLG